MAYDFITVTEQTPVSDIASWANKYLEQHIQRSHDEAPFTLATPDDSLVVVGPPRLAQAGSANLFPVGFVNTVQYSESRQVQPLKAIGSRRHIFASTNSPVQGSIGRMLILGSNLARALYAVASEEDLGVVSEKATHKVADRDDISSSSWFTNLEEDLFRIPIGIGIIYQSPGTMTDKTSDEVVGADYIEVCQLINRNVSLQSGQAMIMEQVSFMADRVIPWNQYQGIEWNASSE